MREQKEFNIRYGWGLFILAMAQSTIVILQYFDWAPAVLSNFAIPWEYGSWLSGAFVSYMVLFLFVPRYPIVVVLVGIECLIILFALSAIYGQYAAWRDIISVYVETAPAFEPQWLSTILITHSSYAVALFVCWLDNWRNPGKANQSL